MGKNNKFTNQIKDGAQIYGGESADIVDLRAENDRLKADNDVWRDKYAMIQDDLAKAWKDKRELVEALGNCIPVIDRFYHRDFVNSIELLIAKHKEG